MRIAAILAHYEQYPNQTVSQSAIWALYIIVLALCEPVCVRVRRSIYTNLIKSIHNVCILKLSWCDFLTFWDYLVQSILSQHHARIQRSIKHDISILCSICPWNVGSRAFEHFLFSQQTFACISLHHYIMEIMVAIQTPYPHVYWNCYIYNLYNIIMTKKDEKNI